MTVTHERLLEMLSYDPESGEFRRRQRRGAHAPGSRAGSLNQCKERVYWAIAISGKSYLSHRLAWFYMTGEWPSGNIDHIDGDGLNNAWANLRVATTSQNQANAKLRAGSTSGRKGVTWHRSRGKWQASIKRDGRNIHLGLFDDLEQAHAAYMAAARVLFGEFARAA